MQYIHVKNLERFHPGYKDRSLLWAKINICMVQGDPEMEMIDNETDKWRFICFILLELQAKKPLPLDDGYLRKKGFDTRKRPISLTIQMLHNFLDIVTEEFSERTKSRVEESRVEESVFVFDEVWNKYPSRVGKKYAERNFKSSVKTQEDFNSLNVALNNYLNSDRVKKGFIQNGSTWFNNWRDWLEIKSVNGKLNEDRNLWKTLAIKDCSNCRGDGAVYAPGNGTYGRCYCTTKKDVLSNETNPTKTP